MNWESLRPALRAQGWAAVKGRDGNDGSGIHREEAV